jgi:diacylglycerol kinase (ATP)
LRRPALGAAFAHAWAGIAHAWRTQRNLRVQGAVAVAVLAVGAACRLPRAAWLAIVLAIALVLALEVLNTAVEAVVDLVSPAEHPLARVAKDCAAGAVLIAALGAVAIGVLAFWPR